MDPNNNNLIDNLEYQIECPISKQIMKDPVIACDGNTYERYWIERHFKTFDDNERVKSPMTNNFLENRNLIPNLSLKSMIELIISQGMLNLEETKKYVNHNELFNIIKQKEVNKNLEIFNIEDKYKIPFLKSITIDYSDDENKIIKNILLKKSNNDLLLLSQIKSSNKIGINNFIDEKLDNEIINLIKNSISEEIQNKIEVELYIKSDNFLCYQIWDESKVKDSDKRNLFALADVTNSLFVEKDEKNQLKFCQESKNKLTFDIKKKLTNKYSLISNNKIYIDNQLEPGYRYRLIEELVENNFSKEIISKNKSEAKLNILIKRYTGEVLINDDHILTLDFEDEYESDDTKPNKRRFEYFPLDYDDKLKLLNTINERLNNYLSNSVNREFTISEPNLDSEYIKELVNKKPDITNINLNELDVLLNLNKDDNELIKNILLDKIFPEKFSEFIFF